MGLYENIARLKEVKLCNIVLVPFRLSASGRNKLYYYHHHAQSSVRSSAKALLKALLKALPKALPKTLQHLYPPSVLAMQ